MPDLKMLQWPDEVDEFDQFVIDLDPGTILEIGTGPGGFIQHLGRLLPAARLVTVDKPVSGDATGLSQAASIVRNKVLEAEFGRRIDCILGDSHDAKTLFEVDRILGPMPDVELIFLDGDDTYDGKAADVYCYGRFLSPYGYLATHDIDSTICGVPAFWRDLKSFRTRFQISGGHPWGGIGVWRP